MDRWRQWNRNDTNKKKERHCVTHNNQYSFFCTLWTFITNSFVTVVTNRFIGTKFYSNYDMKQTARSIAVNYLKRQFFDQFWYEQKKNNKKEYWECNRMFEGKWTKGISMTTTVGGA